MVSITGSDFAAKINDSDLTATQSEYLIDTAVDWINLVGVDLELANMSGAAGSKTLSATSNQRGIIYFAARAIYASFWKNAGNQNVNVGGIGLTNMDLMSNPVVLNVIREAANKLHEADWSRAII